MKPEAAFGHTLRHFRKELNISQEKLSQESGLDRSYISLLERGLRQPTLTSLLHIARALDVSMVEMIKRVEGLIHENKKS